MHPDGPVTLFLATAPLIFMVAIAVAMWIRKIYKDLPVFFSYMLYQILSTVALFAFWLLHRPGSPAYFIAYWSSECLSIGLGFAVLYELFRNLLTPYQAIQNLARWLFIWAAIILAAVALISAFDHGHEAEAIVAGVFVLERCVRIVQAGLLLFIFIFARSLGLTWRSCALGVALGFACFVGFELTLIAWRMRAGASANFLYPLLTQSSFDLAVLTWAAYFLQPQPIMVFRLPEPNNELARWNHVLSNFLYR